MRGPGKYDAVATVALEMTSADCVLVAVLGGVRGSGFSVQGDPALLAHLPRILRDVADQIEKDMRGQADG